MESGLGLYLEDKIDVARTRLFHTRLLCMTNLGLNSNKNGCVGVKYKAWSCSRVKSGWHLEGYLSVKAMWEQSSSWPAPVNL